MPEEISTIRQINVMKLPQPIGELCRIYSNIPTENHAEKIPRLKELFEVVIKLLGTTMIKAYLADSDNYIADKDAQKLNEKIDQLDHPSLGHWVGILRDCVRFYAKRKDAAPSIILPIVNYYTSKIPGGKESATFIAVSEVASFLNQKFSQATIQSLCDFLVNVRNKLDSGGHGASLTPVDTENVSKQLETVITCIVDQLNFFDTLSLIYVEKVTNPPTKAPAQKTIVYEAKSLSNVLLTRDRYTQETADFNLCGAEELHIAVIDENTDALPTIETAISLSPLVIYQNCTQTKTEQAFFFNGKRGKSLEYLCYATGSFYWPPDLEHEFENISKVISGEIKASDIFLPTSNQATNATRIPTAEERKKADEAAQEALLLVKQSAPELALKKVEESLKFSTYCAPAYFAEGLAYCELGRLSDSSRSFHKCYDLNPNEIVHLLACAFTSAAGGETEQSLEYFRKVKKLDATNEIVAKVLSTPDNVQNKLFGQNASVKATLHTVRDYLIQQLESDNQELYSYLFRLPPWKQIYKLSKRKKHPISPALSSSCVSLALFLIPIFIHLPLLNKWGLISSESIALYARHGIIAMICFCGLYYVFAFNSVLKNTYTLLGKIVLMPRSAYRQWYMSEMATTWGSANSLAGKNNAPSQAHNDEYLSKELLNSDKHLFLPYITILFLCLPIQFFCSGDWNPLLPYPSEIAYSLKSGVVTSVNMSESWSFIQFSIRHLIYYIEVYLCAYGATMIFRFISFFPRILNLPIRYYPGIPSSLTLKMVSGIFLHFSLLAITCCLLMTLQLYAFDCYSVVPFAAITYLILIFAILPIYIICPPIAVCIAMNRQREKILEEFSTNLEQAYGNCVNKADSNSFDTLINRAKFLTKLKTLCPIFPLTRSYTILTIGLLASTFFIVWGYFYISNTLGWPQF